MCLLDLGGYSITRVPWLLFMEAKVCICICEKYVSWIYLAFAWVRIVAARHSLG